MASILITHLGAGSDFPGLPKAPLTLRDLGTAVRFGHPITVTRAVGDVARMESLIEAKAAGKISVAVTLSSAEQAFATVLSQLAGVSGSGAPPTIVIWRENEPIPSGTVYATFQTAFAALAALSGPRTMCIDVSLTPDNIATIPTGTFDCKGEIGFLLGNAGGAFPYVEVDCSIGTLLVNPASFEASPFPGEVDTASPAPTIKLTGEYTHHLGGKIEMSGYVIENANDEPIIFMHDGAQLKKLHIALPATVNIRLLGLSNIETNAITGDGHCYVSVGASSFVNAQGAYSGADLQISPRGEAPAIRNPVSSGHTSDWATSAPPTVQAAIDRMSALLKALNGGTAIP